MVSDYKINRELEQNEFFYEDAMQNHEESDSYNENGVRVRFNIKGAFDPSKVKTVD